MVKARSMMMLMLLPPVVTVAYLVWTGFLSNVVM